ncbi:Olfactory receptor 7E24 [Heterocephalus glaber]|uniref:Olfactory receptor n=1 Tax=Heterocephalus glaber TaxID=10181 RepID=G5C451_HETGA|nr:Olfactory receptor 7E24 [Heterocephalus glaber]
MKTHNLTYILEFHLIGFSEDPDLQPVLFGLFLSMYLVTVLGNLLIILAVISDSHLHTPMYFFLSNLSAVDICFTSTVLPEMIVDISTHSRVISYMGCLTQMSFFLMFACMDAMLLTVMAYDRFLAICHPLHYAIIMNPRLCVLLLLLCVFISLLDSQLHNLVALQFTCFKDVEIANFFCHPSQLLRLSCYDTLIKSLVTYLVGAILGFFPMLGILFSYCKIVSSILKISSSGGRCKAFSTCSSHLSVVCLFYGTAIGVYLGSSVSYSPRKGMVLSLMYTVVTPMLNPFIYSLRNRDITSTLKRLHCFSSLISGCLASIRDAIFENLVKVNTPNSLVNTILFHI